MSDTTKEELSPATSSPTTNVTAAPAVHPLDYPPRSRLFVKGGSEAMTEEFLQTRFGEYGELDHIQVVYTKDTNEPKGFAFVKFRTAEDAQIALKAICDTRKGVVQTSQGNDIRLEVTIAQPRGIKKVREVKETPTTKPTKTTRATKTTKTTRIIKQCPPAATVWCKVNLPKVAR
jgi:RNA recognition motif-containing protein